MDLHVKTRTIFGKKTKALRRNGLIPAELYGHNISNLHLSVNEKEFEKTHGRSASHGIVTVVTEKKEKMPVLVSNISKNPISGRILSIDLHQVRMDEEITAKISIEFTGEAPAVKKGLVLVKVMNEIEIKALPGNIPNSVTISLESLENPHDNISVKNLTLPKNIKILNSPENIIVTVTERKEEVIETSPPTTATETAPAEPTAPETK